MKTSKPGVFVAPRSTSIFARDARSLDADAATRTARRLVDGRVCECGALVFDHSRRAAGKLAVPGLRRAWAVDRKTLPIPVVNCKRFRPVQFTVERAR